MMGRHYVPPGPAKGFDRRTGLGHASAATSATGCLSETLVTAIIVAAAYFVAARIGLNLAFAHTSISAIWAPSGIALAAVLLGGYRMLGAVAAGAFLANITTDAPLSVVLFITAGNVLEALAGAWLLRRVVVDPRLERISDVVCLVLLAAVASTAISATIGVGSLVAFGGMPGSAAVGAWRTWWLGDAAGDLLVGSAILVFARTSAGWLRTREAAQTVGLTLLLAVVAFLVLRYDRGLPYLVFPALLGLALACRQRGAVLGGLVVAATAVWLTRHGYGPFVGGNPDSELIRAQMFVTVAAVAALLVAAARSEREVAETALARLAGSERALADAQRLAQVGSFEWDMRSGRTVWSAELYRILGLDPAVDPPTYASMRRLLHEDDRASVDAVIRRACQDFSAYESVHRIVRPDGQLRTLRCHGRVECDEAGMPVRMVGTAVDITAVAFAEERFRALFETAPYARVVIDPAGAIVLVNSHTGQLFGYGRDELLGRPVRDLIPVEGSDVWHVGSASDAAGDSPPLELRARRRDGSEFPVEVSLTPLVSEQGRLVSVAITDITERKLAAEALAYRASHDPLTGLPNRTLFLDRLEHAISRARRSRRKLAVMFLDLDDFKLVNDTRGHDVGDLLLIGLTPRLNAALRPGDTIARFGGDEFVVLCEDLADDADAVAIAERIEHACGKAVVIGDHEHVVSVSIGVVVIDDPTSVTPSDVLRDADTAMYRAKAVGKGRIEVFDDRVRARLVERIGVEGALRRAVPNGELRVVYQPIVALADHRIVAAEALLRWQHPERGLLDPADFMQIAESSELIVPIGEWVIEQACRQAVEWRRQDPERAAIRVAVNVSAREVASAGFLGAVLRILRETGLEPGLLEFELTESTLLEDLGVATRVLRQLDAVGARIVLDDFGTGFSSLAYLKRLPISALKIDRSLIGALGGSGEDASLVDAVVSMADALGVTVTAEGVETHAQLARLRVLGCGYAQGRLLAPPAGAAEVGTVLAQARKRGLALRRELDRMTA